MVSDEGSLKLNSSSFETMSLNILNTFMEDNRVRTGHGKPGKSWNLSISVSMPGKSWNLIVGYGKAWKIIVCVVRKLLQVSISKDKIK